MKIYPSLIKTWIIETKVDSNMFNIFNDPRIGIKYDKHSYLMMHITSINK